LVHKEKVDIIPIPFDSQWVLQIHKNEGRDASLIENIRILEVNSHLY
jgi:hypothetical protein